MYFANAHRQWAQNQCSVAWQFYTVSPQQLAKLYSHWKKLINSMFNSLFILKNLIPLVHHYDKVNCVYHWSLSHNSRIIVKMNNIITKSLQPSYHLMNLCHAYLKETLLPTETKIKRSAQVRFLRMQILLHFCKKRAQYW